MKYLHAALVSQAKPSFNPAKVDYIKWAGIGVYSLTIWILYLCKDFGYPGTSNHTVYIDWIQTTGRKITLWTHYIWLVLCFLSAAVTVYAIIVLQHTVRILRHSNPHLKLNFGNVYVAQSVYYSLQFLIVFGFLLADYQVLSREKLFTLSYFLPFFDLGGQLLICYICWTQGTTRELKVHFSLMPDEDGNLVLQYTPIESLLRSKLRARNSDTVGDALSEDDDQQMPAIPPQFSHAIFYDFIMVDDSEPAVENQID